MVEALVVAEKSALLQSRRRLAESGWTERALASAVRAGRLHRVRRGWYIEQAVWSNLTPEAQHVLHALAVVRDAEGAVAASLTAAAVWGLPLPPRGESRVHLVTAPSTRISSGPDVFRHVGNLPAADVTVVDGIACTTFERTIFDIARTCSAETALACADAAERRVAWRANGLDPDRALAWRTSLDVRWNAAPGLRGIRRGRRIVEFADGRAQLPGESISRLYLHRLGFAPPRLQVPIPGPSRSMYFADFGLDDAGVFGEFDGRGKYIDARMRDGRTIEQVVIAEKEREDWIRGSTGYRVIRWGYADIASEATLGARLAAFGVRPR